MSDTTQHSHDSHHATHVHKLAKDPKFIETLKVFVLYGLIVAVADFILRTVVVALTLPAYYHYYGYGGYGLFGIIPALIGAAIGSAIIGAVFFFFYAPVHAWIKKNAFISKYIYSLFTLFWIPTLIVALLNALSELTRPYGFYGTELTWIIIALAVHLAIFYWYSNMVSSRLAAHYPW